MNKTKKFSLAIVALLLCMICIVAFVACDDKNNEQEKPPQPTMYTVTFVYNNGAQDTTAPVTAGGTVVEPVDPSREGYNFLYWAKEGEQTAYDFSTVVNSDITLNAVWEVKTVEKVRLTWATDDAFEFVFDGFRPTNVAPGTQVSFSVRFSPYYIGTPVVKAGNVELQPDNNGVYTVTVNERTTFSVDGLSVDTTPLRGYGTSFNPYIITRPAHLKAITDSINAGEEKYAEAVIRMDADIDFNGETINPIGNDYYPFSGEFDGNGHTISNFELASEADYYGVFGLIGMAVIRNLNVETDILIDASDASKIYIVGGIAAYNIGSDIINCSFNGSIDIVYSLNTETNIVFAGGIAGFSQGYSTTNTGTISYSEVNATIKSTGSKEIYSAGGIVGAMVGTADSAVSIVNNCVFVGDVTGRIRHSGGIAGALRGMSAIANCYVVGNISAQNQIASANDRSTIAAAGAIVGIAENETAVSNCVANATVTSRGASLAPNQIKGTIIGVSHAAGSNYIDDRQAVVKNSFATENGIVEKDGVQYDVTSGADMLALLGWYQAEWSFDENGVKAVEPINDDDIMYSVTFDFGTNITREGQDGQLLTQTTDVVQSNMYIPINWVYEGSGMNTFTADNGYISYGYFFDEERTDRIPSSYVLTNDMTVYVGFADYSSIENEYYAVIGSNEVKLTFDDNGMVVMSYDAVVLRYMYVYNGEYIVIKNALFVHLGYNLDGTNYSAEDFDFDYICTVDELTGSLTLTDGLYFADDEKIVASKANDAMGVWYATDGRTYTFYADGQGVVSSGSYFTYTCRGSLVSINMGNSTINATLSSDKTEMRTADGTTLSVTRFDEYLGAWESDFATMSTIEFDGKGSVNYKGHAYAYSIDPDNGVLTFENITVSFDENGMLNVLDNGKLTVYGREGSYIGSWRETKREYWFILGGINKDGIGYGRDSQGISFTYGATEVTVDGETSMNYVLYYRTTTYGMGSLSITSNGEYILDSAVLTADTGYGGLVLVFDYFMTYVDPFLGTWHGENGLSLEFNGNGAYDINFHSAVEGDWIVQGQVTVFDDGDDTTVHYTYNRNQQNATFTYNGINYVATLSEDGIEVNGIAFYESDGLDAFVYTADGVTVTFNGKSPASNGLAVVEIDGIETTYNYTFEDGIAQLTHNDELVYSVVIDGNAMYFVDANSDVIIELGIWHYLVGKEFVVTSSLSISFDTYFNLEGMATGHFNDSEIDVAYIDETYVGLYMGDTFLYYVQILDPYTIAVFDNQGTQVFACIPDGLQGTYTAADGSVLVLDGRSKGAEIIYPSARLTVTEIEDGDEIQVTYQYTYYVEDDVMYISEIDRSGDEDVLVKIYIVSTTATDNAVAYVGDNDITLYIEEIAA